VAPVEFVEAWRNGGLFFKPEAGDYSAAVSDVSERARVVVVGGHVRSGTTMMGQVINTHPDIVAMHELRAFSGLKRTWFGHMRRIKHKNLMPLPLDRAQDRGNRRRLRTWWFIARYGAFLLPHFWWIRYEDVRRALQWANPSARIVGDQSAQSHSQMFFLSRQPDCRVIIMHRDCRDVAQSTLRLTRTTWANQGMGKLDASAIATRWVRQMERLDRVNEGVMLVRYEEFVANPGPAVERLGAFLGVDPAGFRTDFVRKDSVGKHRDGLTADETAAVLKVAGPTLRRMGYVE